MIAAGFLRSLKNDQQYCVEYLIRLFIFSSLLTAVTTFLPTFSEMVFFPPVTSESSSSLSSFLSSSLYPSFNSFFDIFKPPVFFPVTVSIYLYAGNEKGIINFYSFSNCFLTVSRYLTISSFCGQAASHCLQPMQSAGEP